jgi:Copper amine oxidase, enzyme domain
MPAFGSYHNVIGAGWSVYWKIPVASAGGLEIWWADFQGHRVLWRGSQPFALVPYHGGSPTFKDGLDSHCGGAPFTALKHTAPNSMAPWQNPGPFVAAVDTDAVVATTEPADDFNPARLIISAKFQCGWYQYVHSWEFNSDGVITPHVAMGGHVHPGKPDVAHVHHMYFRLDLDIDGLFPRDVFEVFNHNSFAQPGGDKWDTLNAQGKLLHDPDKARKWRVRNTVAKNDTGQFKGYEVELPRLAGRDQYSTGDVWVTVYRGDGFQQGENVGLKCTDVELANNYAVGPLDTVNGSDMVFWLVVRAHHEPRNLGEEADHLPYHYEEFSIVPRSFRNSKRDRRGQG